MPTWQRLLLTIAAVLAVSFAASMAWRIAFGAAMPGYLAGLIGGLSALPVWEFSRRIGPKT